MLSLEMLILSSPTFLILLLFSSSRLLHFVGTRAPLLKLTCFNSSPLVCIRFTSHSPSSSSLNIVQKNSTIMMSLKQRCIYESDFVLSFVNGIYSYQSPSDIDLTMYAAILLPYKILRNVLEVFPLRNIL